MTAQKSSKVTTNHQKIDRDLTTMLRAAKEEKQTDNRLNQDFSRDNNNVNKEKSSSESSC